MENSSSKIGLFLIVWAFCVVPSSCQLSSEFYKTSCPTLVSMVRRFLERSAQQQPWIAASLLRLHFHDCFVNGCDASILLNNTDTFIGEQSASPNLNSARGFDVVDNLKKWIEPTCPGVVSCADLLALSAREVVVMLGGPSWTVSFGRRDSLNASVEAANIEIPSPTSTLGELVAKFNAKGFSEAEMVALSGAHTIGQAHCISFKDRLVNFNGTGTPDPSLSTARLEFLEEQCLHTKDSLVPLDSRTPNRFDVSYFESIASDNALLSSDELIFHSYAEKVEGYVGGQARFFEDFASAMVKMGNLSPLTGNSGEVRQTCSFVNSR